LVSNARITTNPNEIPWSQRSWTSSR